MFVLPQQPTTDDRIGTPAEMTAAELALVSGAGRPATDGVISAPPMPNRGF